ncbi:MAG: alpha/beta hydrolase family protein [Steroidobacteraceae bacterium]
MTIGKSGSADTSGATILATLVAALCIYLVAPVARAAEAMDCHIGTYRLSGGGIVDIAPSESNTLRWRRFDGTTGALTQKAGGLWTSSYGWTGRPDGKSVRFSACESGRISFDGVEGRRIKFDVTDTTFTSHGTTLAGRLILPKGTAVVPIVILLHGAEHDSARQFYALQRMLPAEEVGAFVFDKRGTGGSGGSYSQDFNLLADDDVAAMREAKRLSGSRAGRIGYQAGSQGGWVAPLAANRAHVDFVIVCFGLAVSVIDEDQQEVEIEMREKGDSPADIASALEVARAAETVIASGFTEGFGQFDAVRAKYKDARWYKDLHGNYTYLLLPYSESQLRDMSAKFKWGTPFHYNPMPTLRSNTTPQLWILGGEDYEAPSAETGRRVKSLIADDLPFTLAVYPGAEHGMTLFETAAGGERLSTRYAPGYFAMIRDFARDGGLKGVYGDAEIARSKGGAR